MHSKRKTFLKATRTKKNQKGSGIKEFFQTLGVQCDKRSSFDKDPNKYFYKCCIEKGTGEYNIHDSLCNEYRHKMGKQNYTSHAYNVQVLKNPCHISFATNDPARYYRKCCSRFDFINKLKGREKICTPKFKELALQSKEGKYAMYPPTIEEQRRKLKEKQRALDLDLLRAQGALIDEEENEVLFGKKKPEDTFHETNFVEEKKESIANAPSPTLTTSTKDDGDNVYDIGYGQENINLQNMNTKYIPERRNLNTKKFSWDIEYVEDPYRKLINHSINQIDFAENLANEIKNTNNKELLKMKIDEAYTFYTSLKKNDESLSLFQPIQDALKSLKGEKKFISKTKINEMRQAKLNGGGTRNKKKRRNKQRKTQKLSSRK